MPEDFLDYFEKELCFLREMGNDFAGKYPKVAGRLLLEPDKCEDPHTERLIEAFAFLCARIQRKIDDGLPEITQSLLQVLYPHLSSPLPSVSVVRFNPLLKNVPGSGYRIDQGTPLFSRPVDGMPCQFRTVYPMVLRPMEVVSAHVEEPKRLVKGAQQVVRIRLKLHGTSFSRFQGDSLRFFVNGQPQHAYPLYQLLLNNVCRIECTPAGAPEGALPLESGCLSPVGFAAGEGLFPYPEQSFPGYRLLLEYFAFPQKFLFFELTGFSALGKGEFGDVIDLLLYLNEATPDRLVVGAQTFCLHATPVVNAFQKTAEPIRHEHEKTEYRLLADLRREEGTEVLSVDDVTATVSTSPLKVKKYRPVYSLEHYQHRDDVSEGNAYWHMQRRPSSLAHQCGTDVFLAFCGPGLDPAEPSEETVMVRVTCSNRDLPSQLSFCDPSGDFQIEAAAPVETINCLIRPTRTLRPPLSGAQQWRLISHLSLNYLSLIEGGRASLKEMLALYDFGDSAATRQQISGIVSVTSRHVTRRIGAAFCRGVEVTVEFDEDKYIGSSLYLFASVLERFLGQYVSVNSFVQFVARTTRDNRVLKQWPPRNGDRVLI